MSNNNPKPDFTATFSLGTFTVNVPSDVHNADVNPSENNVIKTNGTYNVPNDKSGWNSFSVNVTPTITPNVADLMITNDVYDYVKEHHDGMLILPGNDPTIIEETMFDTHGKDYATSVIIDLNFLDKELKIDPAHQKLRLSEDEEDFEIYDYEKDGDYDVRVKPKPEPEPELTKKSRFITFKSNTRDIIEDDPTYRNIGSFTIVAPILNSIVLPAGTYTFDIGIYNNENNTDYLGVKTITFTPSVPSSLSKTVEIDTIQNNVTTLYLPQSDGERNIMPALSSNSSSNKVTLITDNEGYYKNYLYFAFDNNNDTYYGNTNGSDNYFIVQWNDGPQVINDVRVICFYDRGSCAFQFNISGSNDNENYTQLYNGTCITEGTKKTFDLVLNNNMNNAYTYYKIYSYVTDGNPWDNSSRIYDMKFIQYGNYQYYDSFTIINKTASDLGTPIMKSYNTNNQTVSVSTSNTNIQSNFTGNITVPLESKTIEINSNDTTTITPSNNYYGLSNVTVTTTVPTIETGYNITGLYVGSKYYPFSSLSHSTSHSGTNWCGVSIDGDRYTLATIGGENSRSLSGDVYYYNSKSSSVGIGDADNMIASVSLSWNDQGFGTFYNYKPIPSTTNKITISKLQFHDGSVNISDMTVINNDDTNISVSNYYSIFYYKLVTETNPMGTKTGYKIYCLYNESGSNKTVILGSGYRYYIFNGSMCMLLDDKNNPVIMFHNLYSNINTITSVNYDERFLMDTAFYFNETN